MAPNQILVSLVPDWKKITMPELVWYDGCQNAVAGVSFFDGQPRRCSYIKLSQPFL
jgi:hypothetical protein